MHKFKNLSRASSAFSSQFISNLAWEGQSLWTPQGRDRIDSEQTAVIVASVGTKTGRILVQTELLSLINDFIKNFNILFQSDSSAAYRLHPPSNLARCPKTRKELFSFYTRLSSSC